MPQAPPQASILPLILIAMLVASAARRPDADDGAYHALSLAAAENPDDPILCCEVLHGISEAPLDPPTQRLNSLEPLIALPVLLFEIAPWRVHHHLLPLLGAVGLCLAYRRLYQRLVPERWLPALSVTLVLFVALGTAHAWHGNFGLVRLHQGKGLLVSVLLPLLWVYGLEAGAWGGVSRWLRLVGGQVAAIGINQSAMVIAPATAFLAVLAALPGRRADWRSHLKMAMFALLPASIGLGFWPLMSSRFEQAVADQTSEKLLSIASEYVLGTGRLPFLMALCVLIGPWCVPSGVARRWAILAPLVVLAGPMNPWLARHSAVYVFGEATFWRFFWLLPMIAILALVLTAAESFSRWTQGVRHGVTVLSCVLVLFTVDEWLMASENRVDWGLFQPKMPAVEGAAAAALVEAVEPRSIVLAPAAVAPWVATFPNRPFLWAVAPRFMRRAYGYRDERRRLLRLASGGKVPGGAELLARRLPVFSGVVLDHRISEQPAVRDSLIRAGFVQRGDFGRYRLWIRESAPDRSPQVPGV